MYILLIIGNTTGGCASTENLEIGNSALSLWAPDRPTIRNWKLAGVWNYDAANVLMLWWTEYWPVVLWWTEYWPVVLWWTEYWPVVLWWTEYWPVVLWWTVYWPVVLWWTVYWPVVLWWTEYWPVVGQVLADPRRSMCGRKLGLHCCFEVLRACACVCGGGLWDGTEAIRPWLGFPCFFLSCKANARV